ncbi:Ankyrin repeat domain-containing protein 39 [Aphanomyces cochlioides]|nr:Ankyrin repeat domain-containing protein 39 [Aphanomyces cochlioides]
MSEVERILAAIGMEILKHFGWPPHKKEKKLLRAVIDGDLEAVRTLLKDGADVNFNDKMGSTPLKQASQNGHVDIVKELLSHGASIDAPNKVQRSGKYKTSN